MTNYDKLLKQKKLSKNIITNSIGEILVAEFGPDSVFLNDSMTIFTVAYKDAVAKVLLKEFDTKLTISILGLMLHDLPSTQQLYEKLNDLNRTLQWGAITYNPDTQTSLVVYRSFVEEDSLDNFMYPLFHILTFILGAQKDFHDKFGGVPYEASDHLSMFDES